MTPLKRYVGAGSAAALLAFSLTACGGAPTDASTKDFCDAVQDFPEVTEDAGEVVDNYKEYADKLEEVGTPEGISDDARDGFDIFVDELGDLDEDKVKDFIEDPSKDVAEVSDDDQKKVDEFTGYADKECGVPEEGAPEE